MEKEKKEERIQKAKRYSRLLDDYEFIEENSDKDNTKKVIS